MALEDVRDRLDGLPLSVLPLAADAGCADDDDADSPDAGAAPSPAQLFNHRNALFMTVNLAPGNL